MVGLRKEMMGSATHTVAKLVFVEWSYPSDSFVSPISRERAFHGIMYGISHEFTTTTYNIWEEQRAWIISIFKGENNILPTPMVLSGT
jgi:hypothetical protein